MQAEHPIRVEVGHGPANGPHPMSSPKAEAERPSSTQTPFIDIYEGPEGLTLEADLPGVSRDRLTIQLEDNVLTLHAKVEPVSESIGRPIHVECPIGDFHRSFILSDEVDRERISADLKNGVLRLTLPKADRSKTRRIEIQSS